MRISKLSSVLLALAVGAIGSTLRAEDTPAPAAQVKADAKAKPAADKRLADKPAAQAKAKKAKLEKPGMAYPGADLGLKQIPAPPLPISASKADRLAVLLGKYQADRISPEEYHSQRSAILAEP
jgi:hypothetical protein